MRSHQQLFCIASVVALLARGVHAERVVVVAGGGDDVTGPATRCRLHAPFGMDFDNHGNMYIVEMAGGERVLRVDSRGMLAVLAGTGEKGDSGDGGPAAQAQFNGMHSLAVGPADDLFIADTWNNRVRRIDAKTGKVFPFAGTGRKGFRGDGGPASAAEFGNVYCVAFDDGRENLYLADLDNRRVRAVNLKTGIVTTVAGNGTYAFGGDGAPAASAQLGNPSGLAIDAAGDLFIADTFNSRIRVVTRGGTSFRCPSNWLPARIDGLPPSGCQWSVTRCPR